MADIDYADDTFTMSISLYDMGVYEELVAYMADLGQRMVDTAETLIHSSSPSGEIYTEYGMAYQASAPGEPPAVRTAEYVSSFYWEPTDTDGVPAIVFGSRDPKSVLLEIGTVNMLPRPVIRPAAEAVLSEEGATFEDVIMVQSFEGPIQEFGL